MRRFAVLIIGLALTLAGCVGVPVSGPVERHAPAPQQANPGVEIAPVPPAQGALPGFIVEGFLHAMATYQAGYSVARQFLTTEASNTWQPETGVEIYAAGFPPQASATGVVLAAPLVGTLNAQGVYSTMGAGTQNVHDFGLVRDEDGQWRISRPPRGLLISQSLFSSTWVRADVCFWDATGNWLVPDPRFVPKGSAGLLATARAVLSGPSAIAQEAYRAPLGAKLEVSAVSLGANGAANVELTGDVDHLSADARRKLAGELVWSLTTLEGVTGLRVRGNGTLWELGGNGGIVTTSDFGQGAPEPANTSDQVYLVRDGAIQRAPWDTPSAEPQAVGPAFSRVGSLAARLDGQVVAAITDGGSKLRSVTVRDGTARVELASKGMTLVRWTRQGEMMVALDRTKGTRMRSVRDGHETPVHTEALPLGRIRGFAVAPDGVRVALVLEEQGRRTLGVAAIVRSAAGMRFVGWRELSWSPTTQPALDVGWSGPAELLVLLGATSVTARVVSVDSEAAIAIDVGPIDAATAAQLAVGNAGRAMLRGSDGQTWRFVDAFTWEPWLSKIQQVSLP